jgi:alkylation response protein AidB-like acyl-CoA dehydrogenase
MKTAKLLSESFHIKGNFNASFRFLQTSSSFRSGELSFRPVISQEVLEPSTATLFTEAHSEIRSTMRKIIDNDINPHITEWEKAGQFPRWVFKKFGQAGMLGVQHPVGIHY